MIQLSSNPIFGELLKRGIEFKVQYQLALGGVCYSIEGFYKSGQISLFEKDGDLWAYGRYDEKTKIESFDDLVMLNYEWWVSSKSRSKIWSQPEELWAKEFVRLGLAKKKVQTVESWE